MSTKELTPARLAERQRTQSKMIKGYLKRAKALKRDIENVDDEGDILDLMNDVIEKLDVL
ncbi:MAG: hypothetical protein V3V00_15720 [Saprospiraceae bacterium]